MDEIKKDFSWKTYLVVVILSEIITIFFTHRIWIQTHNAHDLSGIEVMPIWILNSLIFFIFSMFKFIEYKEYKANGCSVVANLVNAIVAILSSIMISIGVYLLNGCFESFFDMDFDLWEIFLTFFYLGIGIALIFPVFKHKK